MNNIDKKEVAVSIIKSAFSIIPYAGQALNELFFDYRGRIKQERLNRFTTLLSEFFSQNSEIDLESMKTEEFSDLLEAVLRKVVLTKSQEKLVRFRDILTSNIGNAEISIENSERYLDIVAALAEVEIAILQHHVFFDRGYEQKREALQKLETELIFLEETKKRELDSDKKGYANSYNKASSAVVQKKTEIYIMSSELDGLDKYRDHSFYKITEDDFLYYKQKLQSLGLLIDRGVGGIGVLSFERMSITEFGKDFLKFILSK